VQKRVAITNAIVNPVLHAWIFIVALLSIVRGDQCVVAFGTPIRRASLPRHAEAPSSAIKEC
jgi:hypothetical protein